MKKLLLIDGNSLMFRSYYATAYTGNLMKTKDGLYTNAVFGFCNMLNKLLEKETYAFVAFDAGKQTFRHKEFSEYKGTRKPLPEELKTQIPLIKEYLDIINVKRMENLDYEADDLLATASTLLNNDFDEFLVVTGDRDLLQLVSDKISVALTKKGVGELDIYTKENFFEKLGFFPEQLIDYKGIVGDTSDNLPGIKGIGEKTAIKLLNDFKTIEGIYDHLDSLTTRNRNLFIEGKDIALRCKSLATLERNAKIELSKEDVIINEPQTKALVDFYTKMEFNSFLKKMKSAISENIQNVDIITVNNVDNKDNINIDNIESTEHVNKIELSDGILPSINGYVTYEIVGNNYSKDEVLGIGLIIDEKNYFLTLDDLNRDDVKAYFENELIYKYVFDYKGLYFILKKHNIELKGVIFDLLLASYLINPSYASEDIKVVCDNFIDNDLPYYEGVYGANTKLHKPEERIYKAYSIKKCMYLSIVKNDVLNQIIDNELEYLLNVEINLSKNLAIMELEGLKVDVNRLKEIGEDLQIKLKEEENKIFELAGEEFNVNSPKQLGEVLFEKLNIPYIKGKKKGKNGYSTSAEVLEKLTDYEIVKRILNYRAVSKILSTYVNGLMDVCKDEYIHPLYKQAYTNTGRLSSIEPNIQNMPIRTELGQVIREVFISRFEDGKILSADYSQIELRVLAHMSKDPKMISAFTSSVDFHTNTASEIFGVESNNISADMRRAAKAINFGIIYGMSSWGLAETLGISQMEANIYINKYFYNYAKAKETLDDFIKKAKETGYTQTMLNRRRYIPELSSSNGNLKLFGERTAMNSPIQGSAADIIKIAMNKVANRMKKENVKSLMIAQVHDELIFDCPNEELELMKQIVKEEMEKALYLEVPLIVGIGYGKNWFDAK